MASAQATAANVAIVSGNGQMTCLQCPRKVFNFLYPLVVKVTDSSGAPIAGKVVNWQFISSPVVSISLDPTSTTDSSGIAFAHVYVGSQTGTASQGFLQATVQAYADGASANFYLTQALVDQFGAQLVSSQLTSPPLGDIGYSLGSGPAGSTGSTPVQVLVTSFATPIPNVSVRLLNSDPNSQPSAMCATQPGADPGSVLTDATGTATCTPIFGSISGKGALSVLVGGLDPIVYDYSKTGQPLTGAIAYDQFAGVQFTVTPVTAALVSQSSGNNQSLNPGQSSSPLVVKVTDATGSVPVGNTSVTWSISPSVGATLSSTTAISNSSGLAQVTVNLSAAATGQFSIKAALTSTPSVFTTFTLNTNVQVSSMTKVAGDGQTAPVNQTFNSPLVVQVNGNNGQPLTGANVFFAITGQGTLSSTSGVTDGSGRAQVTVKAGGTAGTVTVTATIGNISQTFTLTVVPPGPSLTTSSFVNAAGRNSSMSPCSLAAAVATGLAPGLNGLVLNSNSFGPLSTTLANDTVTVNGVAAPLLSVGTVNGAEQVTFQIPCETAIGGSVPVSINVGGGSASANIALAVASPGIFETVMSDNARRAVALRPDGTFVSLSNPARRGEIVRVLVTGMGATTPSVGTGALPVPGSDALVSGQVIVGVNNAGARVVTARLSPNLIGVYEVAFQIDANAPTGNDIVLSVAINPAGGGATIFSNGSKIPIQ
jgi:uncharacterized protein (TIGR03437 family)